MPSVPNRYYNSPWIAQAGANLSDALFGNPEREMATLQGQKIRADIEHQRLVDEQVASDRTYEEGISRELADALNTLGPEDLDPAGNPKPQSYAKLAGIVAKSRKEKPGDVLAFLGGGDKRYIAGQNVLGANYRAQLGASSREDIAKLYAGVKQYLGELEVEGDRYGIDVGAEQKQADRESRERIAQWSNTMHQTVAEIRAKTGATSFDVSPQDQSKALEVLYKRAKAYKARLPAQYEGEIMRKWGALYQQTRNSETAMEQAFDEVMGNPATVESNFLGIGKGTLTPGPQNLDQVVAPGAGPAAAPTAAPAPAAPTGTPPIQLLKEGVLTDFANGTTWTLQNGQPVQVR